MHQLGDGEAIVHLGKLNIIRCESRHTVSFCSCIAGGFKISQIRTGMKSTAAALPHTGHIYGIVREVFGKLFSHQQHTAGPITDGTAVKKMHGPSHSRIGFGIF